MDRLESELAPPFFSLLATVWLIAVREGEERPQCWFPGRMAVPPGSSMQALRVGSGRGPILRTALRGATSERVAHATGSTCSDRVITRFSDVRSERAPRSSPLPS